MLRTSVLLPEPDTPVTTVITLSGNSTLMPFKLLARAPSMVILRVQERRVAGTSIVSSPDKYLSV